MNVKMKKASILGGIILMLIGFFIFKKLPKKPSPTFVNEVENLVEQVPKKEKASPLDLEDLANKATKDALGSMEGKADVSTSGQLKNVFGGATGSDANKNNSLDQKSKNALGGLWEGLEESLKELEEDEDIKALLEGISQEITGMSDHEMEVLEELPKADYKIINSEVQAEQILEKYKDVEYDSYINAKSTEGFKSIVKQEKIKTRDAPKKVIADSKKARELFDSINKDFSFGDNVGKGYNANEKMIYLPLGEKSFADEVIHFKKNDDIMYPMENSLGPPNYQGITGLYQEHIANLGLGGQLTLKFTDNALVDIDGPDLYVFEIGAIEPTLLEVSVDGEDWIKVGKIAGGTATVDINGKVEKGRSYRYVRLTDLMHRSNIPGADIDAVAAIGSIVQLDINSEVLFAFGKSTLSEEGKKSIRVLAEQLREFNNGNINISGHTDDIGSNSSNKALSLARAKAVSKELQRALPKKEFKYKEIGMGEESPIEPNDSDENRKKNRRVELSITPY